ncbi:MAG: phosphoenolpyruvate carboxykinase (GTP) [Candidatus Hodarchaeales archaeon]|jgi:phosphoenolpyruvate carboxykinase (GTP)
MNLNIDREVLDEDNLKKLELLENYKVLEVVETFIKICKPRKVTVIADLEEDIALVRELSLNNGEEQKLKMEGHTIHYDGYHDQARDKKNTKVLLPKGKNLGNHINSIEREEGLKEILECFEGSMEGKEALIRFFCLGPTNSFFSLSALQITDSAYVAHSEDLLYRLGYEEFKRLRGSPDFFYFIHSAGKLENSVTKNVDKRRIYIDLQENRVLSVNNQYAGNSLGLKKLALRLAINKATDEGWLSEHMFITGIYTPDRSRRTYFLGAFPSACGKTSTAMVPGNDITGDDIAYIRVNDKGEARAVNIEKGIFGIIKDVNPRDDPLIYKVLSSPRETIFSNVLINDGEPYWQGMGKKFPIEGFNHSGKWFKGKKDDTGEEIPLSHGNARYTISIHDLENCDPALDDPNGVLFNGIIYGGRDSDTSVPAFQSFDWNHGVFIGASLESETTSATLGAEGVRMHQPMANLDFVVVPLAKYLKSHFEFVKRLKNPDQIQIFSTNYFLKDERGNYYDEIVDKKIWLIWAEGRIHGDYEAIETPIGYIPKYEDLKRLFKEVFNKEYDRTRYEAEFSIRIQKWLEKIARIETIYQEEPNMPKEFFNELNKVRNRLLQAKAKYNSDSIHPSKFQ